MIKPINVSPLNTTSKIFFECNKCGAKDTLVFTNRVINTDNEGDLEELKREPCPQCGVSLGVD